MKQKKKLPALAPWAKYVVEEIELDQLHDSLNWTPPQVSMPSKSIGEYKIAAIVENVFAVENTLKFNPTQKQNSQKKNSSVKVVTGKDALLLDSGIYLCPTGHLLRKCQDDCHYCDYEKSPDDYNDDDGNKYDECIYKGGSKQFVCDDCKQHFTGKEKLQLKIADNVPKFCKECSQELTVGHFKGHTFTASACFDCNTLLTVTGSLFFSDHYKKCFTPLKKLPKLTGVVNESGEVMPIEPKATPPVKKEPQNFYVVLEIDGRKNVIQAGPNAKKGGFKLSVFQRDGGEPTQVLDIRGLVNEFDDTLKLSTLVTSEQLPLFNIKTNR